MPLEQHGKTQLSAKPAVLESETIRFNTADGHQKLPYVAPAIIGLCETGVNSGTNYDINEVDGGLWGSAS